MKWLSAVKEVQRANQLQQHVELALSESDFETCSRIVRKYLSGNPQSSITTALVMPQWFSIIEMLSHSCLYQEALAFSQLAVQCTEKLHAVDAYSIEALVLLGRMQMECHQVQQSLQTLENAWHRLNSSHANRDISLMLSVGSALAYVYARLNLFKNQQFILDICHTRIDKEDYYNKDPEMALMIELSYGNYYLSQNQYMNGIALCRRALEIIYEKGLLNNPAHYKFLCLYASFEKKLGHYIRYYELISDAVKLAEKHRDIQEVQSYWSNLLDSYALLGKWEELVVALHHIESYLKQIGQAGNNFNVCQMYMNTAVLLAKENMIDKATELCTHVTTSYGSFINDEKNLQTRDMLKIHFQIAAIHYYANPSNEAIRELKSILILQETILGEADADTLQTRQIIIMDLLKTRKYVQALEEAEQILELRILNGQHDTIACMGTYQLLAKLSHKLMRSSQAFQYAEKVFAQLSAHIYQVFEYFDEKSWKAFTTECHDFLHEIIGWSIEEIQNDGDQQDLRQSKLENLYSIVLRFKNILYDQEWMWKTKVNMKPNQDALNEYFQFLKRPRPLSDLEQAIRYLSEKQNIESNITTMNVQNSLKPMSVDDLYQRLDSRTVIVDVIRYTIGESASNGPEIGYAAFIITNNGIRLRNWGAAADLEALSLDVLKYLSTYGHDQSIVDDRLSILRILISACDIAVPALSEQKLILNLDGGVLPQLPWQHIFPTCNVFVVPTLTPFPHDQLMITQQSTELVAFAAPLITNQKTETAQSEQLALRLTEPCLCALKRSGKKLRMYTGSHATPEAFANVVSPEILHVAAHGVFSENQQEYKMSCFFLSGIGIGDQDDTSSHGEVTILDVMQMDLRGTKLVVLESCESAKGQYKENEGTFNFVRAFFIAGADAVLTTLWKVSAFFSCVFIDQFYRIYFSCHNLQEAFSMAKAIVRRMKVKDIEEWYQTIQTEIRQLDEGEIICHALRTAIGELTTDKDGYCFNKPAYWACYVLHTRFELEDALNR